MIFFILFRRLKNLNVCIKKKKLDWFKKVTKNLTKRRPSPNKLNFILINQVYINKVLLSYIKII